MAKGGSAPPALPVRRFEMRDLWRVAVWGLTAAGAVLLAVFTGTTDRGNERLTAAAAQLRLTPHRPAALVVQAPSIATDSTESRHLAETVKSLAADRDRLLARLSSLERTLDVTGAVPRMSEPQGAPAASMPAPPPVVSVPETVTVQTVLPRPSPQSQIAVPQTQAAVTTEPADATAAAPVTAAPTRAQFGEIGKAHV